MATAPVLQTPQTPKPVSEFSQNRYLTYPHANGFAEGGKSLVLGQIEDERVSLWKLDLAKGTESKLCSFPKEPEPEKLIWFDVALATDGLVFIAEHSVWIMDLAQPGSLRRIYQAPPTHKLSSISSISADGGKVLVGLESPDRHAALRIDTKTGEPRVLFEQTWWANHFHFCPHDESWIGFSHEGPTDKVTDRVWAWHAREAPQGVCLFDQASQRLCVGHERWSFHTTSAIGIAYGVSPGEPRGLYEYYPDGRAPRLISEGDRDFHVGLSRDGRWAVLDTTGPYDAPGKGWENASDISDILLVDMQSGARRFLARSRQFKTHPRHPHPIFNLDGSSIFYHESSPDTTRNRVLTIPNPCSTEV